MAGMCRAPGIQTLCRIVQRKLCQPVADVDVVCLCPALPAVGCPWCVLTAASPFREHETLGCLLHNGRKTPSKNTQILFQTNPCCSGNPITVFNTFFFFFPPKEVLLWGFVCTSWLLAGWIVPCGVIAACVQGADCPWEPWDLGAHCSYWKGSTSTWICLQM